jgi:hypothetical protein
MKGLHLIAVCLSPYKQISHCLSFFSPTLVVFFSSSPPMATDTLVLVGQRHRARIEALGWLQTFEVRSGYPRDMSRNFLNAIFADPDGKLIDRNQVGLQGTNVVESWLVFVEANIRANIRASLSNYCDEWRSVLVHHKNALIALVTPAIHDNQWLHFLCTKLGAFSFLWEPLLVSAACNNPQAFVNRDHATGHTPLASMLVHPLPDETLLMHLSKYAVQCGDVESNPRDGATSLSLAIASRRFDIVKCLLQTDRLPMGLEWRDRTTGVNLQQLAASIGKQSISYLVNSHITLLQQSLVPTLTHYISHTTPLIPPLAKLVVDQLVG